jgi:hypothetical protein
MMKVDPKKVETWLSQKVPDGFRCECCGGTDWKLAPPIGAVPLVSKGSIDIDGASYLFVVATCKNCTNTKLFNAALMGDVFLASASAMVKAVLPDGIV